MNICSIRIFKPRVLSLDTNLSGVLYARKRMPQRIGFALKIMIFLCSPLDVFMWR